MYILEKFLIISHYKNEKFDSYVNAALYDIVMQSQLYQNQIPEVFYTPNICI